MSTKQKPVAADLMVKDIVTVAPEASVREALDLMTENHVSGLPVLDSHDRCVGVVSASDVLMLEHEHVSQEDESLGSWFDADQQRWEHVRVAADDERLQDVEVREIMSRDVVSVPPDTTAQDIAQIMVAEDVHRILVVDDDQRLHGIIAAFDFVRLAGGAQE